MSGHSFLVLLTTSLLGFLSACTSLAIDVTTRPVDHEGEARVRDVERDMGKAGDLFCQMVKEDTGGSFKSISKDERTRIAADLNTFTIRFRDRIREDGPNATPRWNFVERDLPSIIVNVANGATGKLTVEPSGSVDIDDDGDKLVHVHFTWEPAPGHEIQLGRAKGLRLEWAIPFALSPKPS